MSPPRELSADEAPDLSSTKPPVFAALAPPCRESTPAAVFASPTVIVREPTVPAADAPVLR